MSPPLSLQSNVRVRDGVLFQELRAKTILLNANTGVYFTLEEVESRIWNLIQEKRTLAEVLATSLTEYEGAEEQCREDLLDLGERHGRAGIGGSGFGVTHSDGNLVSCRRSSPRRNLYHTPEPRKPGKLAPLSRARSPSNKRHGW